MDKFAHEVVNQLYIYSRCVLLFIIYLYLQSKLQQKQLAAESFESSLKVRVNVVASMNIRQCMSCYAYK